MIRERKLRQTERDTRWEMERERESMTEDKERAGESMKTEKRAANLEVWRAEEFGRGTTR